MVILYPERFRYFAESILTSLINLSDEILVDVLTKGICRRSLNLRLSRQPFLIQRVIGHAQIGLTSR